MKKGFYKLVFLWLMFCPLAGFCFTFSVAVTHETCAGNGSFTFSVSNPNPGGTIVFVVYKLPNLSTPFSSGTSNVVNGLTAGNYHIVVRETVGGVTTTQEADATVNSTVTALAYSVQTVNQVCSTASTAIVVVTSGNAATYELISGPTTYPPQTSNTFHGLTDGVYLIRVVDQCGNAVVQTFIVDNQPVFINISPPEFTDVVPLSCSSVIASNTLTPSAGTVLAYPLQIQYLLHLPDGTTNTINYTLNSGNPSEAIISQTIPFYINQDYPYDIIVTDACGTTYPVRSFVVENDISFTSSVQNIECLYLFTLNTEHFSGSYSLHFDSYPAGFDPTVFNAYFPGPFSQTTVTFSNDTISVPFGSYTVTVIDECGKTQTIDFEVTYLPPVVNAVGNSNGCQSNSGQIIIFVTGQKILTAIITAAPANYPFSLPHDVTASINAGGILVVNQIPFGDYTVIITDECNDPLDPVQVTVPPYQDQGIVTSILQGCSEGFGSIEIRSRNGSLTSAIITNAPSSYPSPLPHNVSNHIVTSGKLYLNNLPSGNYTFRTTDSCGFIVDTTVFIEGYTIVSSNFSLIQGCGAFDVQLAFISNLGVGQSFWLQKLLDPDTGTWGHPDTEIPYTSGTVPDNTTGIELQNNTTNSNLIFNGTFRIVHHFTSYQNGRDINSNLVPNEVKDCIEILSPYLTFDRVLAINDVYRVPCSGSGNLDVILFTSGEPPLHFTIIEKDGSPFFLDNGSSNLFQNLVPAIYKFQIEDNCGNTIIRTFDVSDLESLVTIYPVCDMFSCSNTVTGNETFNLTTQSAGILGIQSPAEYTLSYHYSLADAQNNNNPITNLTHFNPTNNPQTVYIRLLFNQYPNCYQTGSFNVISGQIPSLHLDQEYLICESQSAVLDAGIGNLPMTTYSWSNGSTDSAITISEPGLTTLSVTATNDYGSCNATPQTCSVTQNLTVNVATIPEIDRIELHDWTANQNSITVITTQNGNFEYSINGINYQTENTFTQLPPGLYTVYVRDLSGCITLQQVVWLLNYPHYFTPNDDGVNDTWYIKNSDNEPHFQVYIYDRYGKLITGFPSGTPGWDGTLNGRKLFSDDYWFVVQREDGRIHKGHFSLKR